MLWIITIKSTHKVHSFQPSCLDARYEAKGGRHSRQAKELMRVACSSYHQTGARKKKERQKEIQKQIQAGSLAGAQHDLSKYPCNQEMVAPSSLCVCAQASVGPPNSNLTCCLWWLTDIRCAKHVVNDKS